MSLRDRILARVQELRSDVNAAKATLATKGPLLAEFEALLATADQGTVAEPVLSAKPAVNGHSASQESGLKRKPSIAVRHFLANKPDGVALKTLVDVLMGKIETDSPDPKRILYNTIYNLRKRGTLVATKDAEGREAVRLAEGENTEE